MPAGRIYVGSKYLTIGSNLYRFCHEYQNNSIFKGCLWTNWIWIDQISINQSHVKERNHQVDLMSQIYGRSWTTIIWLHDEALCSGSFNDLNTALDHFTSHPNTRDLNMGNGLNRFMSQQDSENLNADFGSVGELCYCMHDVLRHPYFSRLWIVQEVFLCRRWKTFTGTP